LIDTSVLPFVRPHVAQRTDMTGFKLKGICLLHPTSR
jgi:hypothetical protein